MIVVGVGCAPNLITVQGAQIIFHAKNVAGSKRALPLASEYIQEGCKVHILQDSAYKFDDLPPDTVVLVTGDPMLAGYGNYQGEVVPGISSFQLAFARLKLPWESASIVSAHGCNHHLKAVQDALAELDRGKNVFILCDDSFSIPQLARLLREKWPESRIVLCENLGYENERMEVGSPEDPPEVRSGNFSLVLSKQEKKRRRARGTPSP